jgi:hypothetical protein
MGATTLTPGQLETVLFALADGRDYRIGRLSDCAGCAPLDAEGAACEAHKADLAMSDQYQDLGEELSGAAR